LLKWSADELAQKAGVGIATIRRFENSIGVPAGQMRVIAALKTAMEMGGVEFIGSPEDGPGVRLIRVAR
jgi:transcriptional regulator with XRE-family HTH domain